MGTNQTHQGAAAPETSNTELTAEGLTAEDKSKDMFFVQLAELAEAMIARHGKEFAMGTLVLSARFIAEGKPLIKRMGSVADWMNAAAPARESK